MGDTPYATAAAKVLAAARVGMAAPPPSAQAREAAIAALAATMGDRRRARGQHRVWLAAAAVVLVALGLTGARLFTAPAHEVTTAVATRVGQGTQLFRAGQATVLAEGGEVASGDRVAAGRGEGLAMRLPTGTTVRVESASELQFVDAGPVLRFALLRGAMRADVAKLRRGERFVVTTADAEIEVRGTSFRLAANAAETVCDEPSGTRLEVFEGVVAVRRGNAVSLVGAGSVWPTGCRRRPELTPPPSSPAAPGARPAAVPVPRARRVAHGAAMSSAPATRDPESTLAEQNDLFGRAMAARRRGDRQAALESFFELERRFPSSPLGESSLVERMRLVTSHDRGAGRAIAREYLARFPGGFARLEAEALIARPPAP